MTVPNVWLTRLELEAIALVLRGRGYSVSALVLLDVGADGCWTQHAVQRACAVAPGLAREEVAGLVEVAIGTRRSA